MSLNTQWQQIECFDDSLILIILAHNRHKAVVFILFSKFRQDSKCKNNLIEYNCGFMTVSLPSAATWETELRLPHKRRVIVCFRCECDDAPDRPDWTKRGNVSTAQSVLISTGRLKESLQFLKFVNSDFYKVCRIQYK